jgi:hypothetical protein
MPNAQISPQQDAAVTGYLAITFKGHGVRGERADLGLYAWDFCIDELPPRQGLLCCVRLDGELLDDYGPAELVQMLENDHLVAKLPGEGEYCCRRFTSSGARWAVLHPEV